MFPGDSKILLVDDMPTMRKLLARVCTQLGFNNITEASDPASAWKLVEESILPFELILADLTLGQSSGKDLLGRVRAQARHRCTAFIMLAVAHEAARAEEILQAGADEVLFKPFNAPILKEKLLKIHPNYMKRKNAAQTKI